MEVLVDKVEFFFEARLSRSDSKRFRIVGVNIYLFHSSSRYQIMCKVEIEMYLGEASFLNIS